MPVIRVLISILFIFDALILLVGLGYIYEYTTNVDKLWTYLIIGILLISALIKPTKKVFPVLFYVLGSGYFIFLLVEKFLDSLNGIPFKLFDFIFPCINIIGFLILIVMSFKSQINEKH